MRHALLIAALTALSALMALVAGADSAWARGCAKPQTAAALEDGLLDWINAERAQRGLRPYQRNGQLDRAAESHACDMATNGFFAHRRPGGPDLRARIKATGYPLKAGNENLAYSRQEAVSSAASIWRNSPPHWAAIIDPALTQIGISVTRGEGRVYWVMNVARPRT